MKFSGLHKEQLVLLLKILFFLFIYLNSIKVCLSQDLLNASESSKCNKLAEVWEKNEQWAWSQVCKGRDIDFYENNEGRKVRVKSNFLQRIVSNNELSSNIKNKKLVIKNAIFSEDLDLSHSSLKFYLRFEDCFFEELVKFDALSTEHDIIFQRTSFAKDSSFRRIKSSRSIYFGNLDLEHETIPFGIGKAIPRSQAASIDLSRASFSGDVVFSNIQIKGKLTGIFLQTSGSLVINNCEVEKINISQSVVKNQLIIIECDVISKDGCIDNLEYSRSQLNLYEAQVGQSVFLNRSKFSGCFFASSLSVGKSIVARDTAFEYLNLSNASVGGGIDFGALSSSNEDKNHSTWGSSSKLNLRNGRAAALVISDDMLLWPKAIYFDGFECTSIGSTPVERESYKLMSAAWYKSLLARDEYSSQTYEQVAKMLRSRGYSLASSEILYASQDRALSEIWWSNGNDMSFSDFLVQAFIGFGYFLFKIFVGFGYRVWYALFWVIFFTLLGAIVFVNTAESKTLRPSFGISFSFDKLLPLVKLNEEHYKVKLEGYARYYFYFHQIVGYIIGSFLISGIAILTKQS